MASAGAKRVEAIAVRDGQIVATGSESDLSGLRTGRTKVIDLDGRTLLPGFVDPHQHSCFVALFSELLTDVGYSLYPTRAQLIAGLKALDAKLPPGQWLAAYNFDNLLQGGDLSMAELDGVSKDRPIFIWYINMHDGAANSAAFKVAQVPQNVGVLPGGGHFGRGPDGQFNGLVYEEPAMLMFVTHALPKITPQVFAKAMTDYFKMSAALGNTTTHEPGTVQPEWIEGLVKLTASGTGRLSASLMYNDMKAADAYKTLGRGAKAALFPNSRFSLFGIKIVGDGSNQTKTGAQTIPYLNTNEKGAPNFPAARVEDAWSPPPRQRAGRCRSTATATPPSTTRLNAIEAAYGANPPHRPEPDRALDPGAAGPAQSDEEARRPADIPDEPRLSSTARLIAISCSVPSARRSWIRRAPASRRASRSRCTPMLPARRLAHLRLVQTAVTRRCTVDNSIIGPDQAISVEEALKAVTSAAAAQIGQGDRIGTLEPGKEADLVILEQDPFKVAPDEIMKSRCRKPGSAARSCSVDATRVSRHWRDQRSA